MTKANKLTIKDLLLVFGVTSMTIQSWRKGGARKTPMPFNQEGRNVSYNAVKIKAWANANSVPMELDPLDLAGSTAGNAKPGPKPKVIDREAEKARDRERIDSKWKKPARDAKPGKPRKANNHASAGA
jgi:hypothetical protein